MIDRAIELIVFISLGCLAGFALMAGAVEHDPITMLIGLLTAYKAFRMHGYLGED